VNILAVREVMTWGVVTVGPDTDIRQAARIMHEQRIGALPVVENGTVVGILSETDVVRTFVEVLGEGVLSKPARWGLEH
jgi:acetoin utilization protein AcuB